MPAPSPTTAPTFSPGRFQSALLAWFDQHRRDLPWRHAADPYAVWLSETMLQQTQVATVIPYYHRFLERFPTVEALAQAPLADVLALWRGLGYYSRARNLHAAAQLLARQGMPRSAAGWRELPGVGRYTAAAIASIAFGEPVAVLDGNVARVLARLLAIEAPPGDTAVRERLWAEAQALIDPRRPGDFNQAMMELGATVCAPREPACEECPVAWACQARSRGIQARLPRPKVRPARKRLWLACAAVVSPRGILLARRKERGLFGGLWELPCVEVARRKSARAALRELGLETTKSRPLAVVERVLSHRDLRLSVFACRRVRKSVPGYAEQRMFRWEEIDQVGISTAMGRAIAAVRR